MMHKRKQQHIHSIDRMHVDDIIRQQQGEPSEENIPQQRVGVQG
jgi:hypothetical protein